MDVKYGLSMFFFLFPLVANASCVITVDGNEMTLIAKKDCLKTPEAQKAFNSAIVVTLENIELANKPRNTTKSGASTLSSAEKIANFEHLERQSRYLSSQAGGPTYYGQKVK